MITVSPESYEILRDLAFKNRTSMKSEADKLIQKYAK